MRARVTMTHQLRTNSMGARGEWPARCRHLVIAARTHHTTMIDDTELDVSPPAVHELVSPESTMRSRRRLALLQARLFRRMLLGELLSFSPSTCDC